MPMSNVQWEAIQAKLEPEARGLSVSEADAFSSAISLKRIADLLDGMTVQSSGGGFGLHVIKEDLN